MTFSEPMINIYSRDLPAALQFYGGLLGFEETFRAPDPDAPDHVELRLDGVTIALSSAEAAERVHGLPAYPGSHGFQLVVWTDQLDTAYGALVAAGVPGVTEPHDTGNDNRNAVVRDPDGNLVELVMKRSGQSPYVASTAESRAGTVTPPQPGAATPTAARRPRRPRERASDPADARVAREVR